MDDNSNWDSINKQARTYSGENPPPWLRTACGEKLQAGLLKHTMPAVQQH
jgi:hypothetical protein